MKERQFNYKEHSHITFPKCNFAFCGIATTYQTCQVTPLDPVVDHLKGEGILKPWSLSHLSSVVKPGPLRPAAVKRAFK